MPKPLLHITLFLLLLALRINAFACDTLCVVYNIKNNKFEIDTSSINKSKIFPCHCNQKELGKYSTFINKLSCPPILIDENYLGSSFFKI